MKPRLKRPRVHDASHLDWIRQRPCLICGSHYVVAAHVRYGSLIRGKRPTGMQEKPSDKWVVPLCTAHHTDGPDAQHKSGERDWWERHAIDPIIVAALLYCASGDDDAGDAICRAAAELVIWRTP